MANDPSKPNEAILSQTIVFPNKEILALLPDLHCDNQELAAALNLKDFSSLVVLMGGAGSLDTTLIPRLNRLYNLAIVPAVAESGAVVIDGGTDAGVMRLMGQSLSDRKSEAHLIGVAPAALVTYPHMEGTPATDSAPLEPNHDHFILTPGNVWGDETDTFFDIVSILLERDVVSLPTTKSKKQPPIDKVKGVGLLIGGDTISRQEVLRAVRLGIGIILVAGSGGLADLLCNALKDSSTISADADIAEIIANGKLYPYQLTDPDKGLYRLIIRELGIDNVLLKAWELFADYDANAKIHQKRQLNIQLILILLGIISAIFGIWLKSGDFKPDAKDKEWHGLGWYLHTALLVLPILTAVCLTVTNKFKPGVKWLLLRAGAETLKSEIYAYRARAAAYALNPEHTLAEQVRTISQRIMRTEVNHSAMIPYDKSKGFPPYMFAASGKDNGFSMLNPDQYIRFRLDDQLNYYRKTVRKLDAKVRVLYYTSFIIAGGATLLSFTENQAWIAVSSSAIAGIASYLGYAQLESSIVKYNQGRTDLDNIKTWWLTLSAKEQALPENFDSLVKHTEQTITAEIDGWVQRMQNSLADLNKAQQKSSGGGLSRKSPERGSRSNSNNAKGKKKKTS
ncbi:DUF4231 domain-containing protein [Mucilaginibacter kameinonensis]|uniref:DUF4231 domain-containing protein n=1 Tax=Mucilaginibacter kameinonensis TaxID=452286 RepID=UPI000EF7C73A|nr:DUF4231 domain-containing protein [Mucilaginibacter kameinonensis]